jgi:hypothetical protein
VHVSNARALFDDFRAVGAPFHQPLERASWQAEGTGAFIVRDPDGNLILFSGRTD